MALQQYMGSQIASAAFPNTGGTRGPGKNTTTTPPAKKRVSAEEKAEQARLDDPYGAGRTQSGGGAKRVKVRRKKTTVKPRVQNSGSEIQKQNNTQQTAQAKQNQKAAKAQQGQAPSHSGAVNRKQEAQGKFAEWTVGFSSNQAPQGPQTPAGKKFFMLGNLSTMMNNDYACQKAGNENDTAFTYRTSESRQLCAALSLMGSPDLPKPEKKKDSYNSGQSKLSPEAFGRQKGLLRQLLAFSAPEGQLPEGLPADYERLDATA